MAPVCSCSNDNEVATNCHPGLFDAKLYSQAYEMSPIYHVNKVKTPVLFQLGAKDLRVPAHQGIVFNRAMKANNQISEISYYPEDCHPLGGVATCSDVSLNLVKWFEKFDTTTKN